VVRVVELALLTQSFYQTSAVGLVSGDCDVCDAGNLVEMAGARLVCAWGWINSDAPHGPQRRLAWGRGAIVAVSSNIGKSTVQICPVIAALNLSRNELQDPLELYAPVLLRVL
jgi:hypothetical protein